MLPGPPAAHLPAIGWACVDNADGVLLGSSDLRDGLTADGAQGKDYRRARVAGTSAPRYGLLWLLLLVVVVFSQVCGHEFLEYDDQQNITQNELVTEFTAAHLAHFWKTPFAGMYIPLTYNFWSLQAKLASLLPPGQATALNPYLFHTINLLLHLANTSLVFLFMRRFVTGDWALLCGTLLFAVHPVQVEAVAWVTGGKDLLSAFFSLLALVCYVGHVPPPGQRSLFRPLLAAVFFLAALLAKPGAAVLPLVVWAVGRGLLRLPSKRLAYELTPWLVLALPIAVVTKMAQPDASHQFLPTLWQRLLIGGDALSFYLLKLLLPLRLGPDYGRTPQFILQQDWRYLTGLLPYVLLALVARRVRGRYLVAIVIFVVALLPVLGFVPFTFQEISTVADRYLYLAMLGPALAVAWAMRQARGRLVWGGGVCVLLLLVMRSATLLPTWHDTTSFSQHALTVNPRSWTAHGNLGNVKAKQNQTQEAIALYQRALELKPDDAKTTFNLGVSYGALNQTEAAIAAYLKTLELLDRNDGKDMGYRAELLRDCYLDLGVLYDKEKRRDEAIAYYQRAITADPAFSFSYANLADLYAEIGRRDEAIGLYQKALTLAPPVKGLDGGLARLLLERGDLAAAVEHFRRELAQTPSDPAARLNLGLALYHQQDFAEASCQFTELIGAGQAPVEALAEAHNGLGAVYMAQGRWQEARQSLQAALRYVPGHQAALENLQKIEGDSLSP